MIIYNYNTETFEYLYPSKARKDPLDKNNFLIPANATKLKPLEPKKGYAVVFNKNLKKWEYVEDHRGQIIYNIKDKTEKKVDYLGETKKGWTLKKPCNLCIWDKNKKEWVKDINALKQSLIEQVNNLYLQKEKTILPIKYNNKVFYFMVDSVDKIDKAYRLALLKGIDKGVLIGYNKNGMPTKYEVTQDEAKKIIQELGTYKYIWKMKALALKTKIIKIADIKELEKLEKNLIEEYENIRF